MPPMLARHPGVQLGDRSVRSGRATTPKGRPVMTNDPEPVCVLVMNAGGLRSGLESELTIDGYAVRCARSLDEAEAELTPSVADVLIVGSLEDRAAPCA